MGNGLIKTSKAKALLSGLQVPCECKHLPEEQVPTIFENANPKKPFKYIQFVEEEDKGVIEYSTVLIQQSYGVAEKMPTWYHVLLTENLPIEVRTYKLEEGFKWHDKLWHISDYIPYVDPYDKTKHRFRYYRRIQVLEDVIHGFPQEEISEEKEQ